MLWNFNRNNEKKIYHNSQTIWINTNNNTSQEKCEMTIKVNVKCTSYKHASNFFKVLFTPLANFMFSNIQLTRNGLFLHSRLQCNVQWPHRVDNNNFCNLQEEYPVTDGLFYPKFWSTSGKITSHGILHFLYENTLRSLKTFGQCGCGNRSFLIIFKEKNTDYIK